MEEWAQANAAASMIDLKIPGINCEHEFPHHTVFDFGQSARDWRPRAAWTRQIRGLPSEPASAGSRPASAQRC